MGCYISVFSYKSIWCWTCIFIWCITNPNTFGTNKNLLDSAMTFISAISLVLNFRVWWSLITLLSTVPYPFFNFIKITWEMKMFIWQCLLRCSPINGFSFLIKKTVMVAKKFDAYPAGILNWNGKFPIGKYRRIGIKTNKT